MVPAMTALATTPANPVRAAWVRLHPDGMRRSPSGLRRARARSTELSPTLASLTPCVDQLTVITQPRAEERLPRQPRHLQRRLPERGEGEVDREHGLRPGDDGRSDCGEADRQGNAAAVARAGDGSARDGRAVRQRLCLRLSEQSVLVVADDAASGRSASRASCSSACSATAGARRNGAPSSAEERQPSRLGHGGYLRGFRTSSGRAIAPKVSQYLDTVREVERRIQKAEAETADNQLPDLDRPVGVPASYADHARLMFDLQVLALQGDVTRVITFQLARETSTRTYPEIGVSDPHHPLTHHGNDPEKIAKWPRSTRSTCRCSPTSWRS